MRARCVAGFRDLLTPLDGLPKLGCGLPWHALEGFGARWRGLAEPWGMTNDLAPLVFAQLPDEPAADYAALLQYRDLGPGRSLRQAAVVTGLSESTLRRIAKRWT